MKELQGRDFVKMTGGGNDFVVFDNRAGWFPREHRREAVATVCRRGLGVGADAVLLLEDDPALDFRMVYFNADGGEAPMCGNGALCIARYARMKDIVKDARMRFSTGSGAFRAEVADPSSPRVTIWLVPPRDLQIDVDAGPGYVRAGYLDTSTPHVIALLPSVEAVEAHDVMGEGRRLRMDPRWEPPGTNANFIAVRDRKRVRLRTYERGVEGETLSCGTGSTAAAILTSLWGLTDPPVVVETSGGIPLTVDWSRTENGALPTDLRLTGDARVVYRGVIEE